MSDTAKMRKPNFKTPASEPTGSVTHDERGNAVWKWKSGIDVAAVTGQHPALPADLGLDRRAAPRPDGASAGDGYDPYKSGVVPQGGRPTKKDLRALAREIAAKKADKGPPTR